jgi:hypothetical protein
MPIRTLTLDSSTFDDLSPTASQITKMNVIRAETKKYAEAIERVIPDGPDKTYMLRKLREIAMWGNVAITRYPDGEPRPDGIDPRSQP